MSASTQMASAREGGRVDALIVDLSDNERGWEGNATDAVVQAAENAGLHVTRKSGKAIELLKQLRGAPIETRGVVVVLAHGRRAEPIDLVDLGIRAGDPTDKQSIRLNSYYLLAQVLAALGATPPFHLLLVVCEGMNADSVAVFSYGVDVLTVTSSAEKISGDNAGRFSRAFFDEIVATRAAALAAADEVARIASWVSANPRAGGSTVPWIGAPGNAEIVPAPAAVPAPRR